VITNKHLKKCRAGVSPAQRARQREQYVSFADAGRRDACPILLAESLSPSVFFCREGTQRTQREGFLSLRSLRSFAANSFKRFLT
jgi:hypothetical protein